MANRPYILVIDDDTRLRRLLDKYLTENGFSVAGASAPNEAEDLLNLFVFDAIIMDVMMPGKNGLDFTRELREKGVTTPILMLTAMGDSSARITGLENGADDYLPKPFEPRELVLRLGNILKRAGAAQKEGPVHFGSYSYDSAAGVLLQGNQQVSLTTAEQVLLKALASKAGSCVSREELGKILDTDNLRAIDVQVLRLRKKLEPDSKNPQCIQTIRGQGYMLARR